MNTSTTSVGWASVSPLIVTEWDARRETAAQIAGRLRPTLLAVDNALGGSVAWEELASGSPIDPLDHAALEQSVSKSVSRGDFGDVFPDYGFELTVSGRIGQTVVTVSMFVGSSISGRRKASNSLSVSFNLGSRPVRQVQAIMAAVVEHWQPATAAASDTATASLSGGRGRFAPIIGQRTWLRNDVGTINTAPEGVLVESLAGGTLLSANDDWAPEQVVAAMTEALESNAIGVIPRGPQQ